MQSELKSISQLQKEIDALTYPPNHWYKILSMTGANKASAQRFNYLIPHIRPLIEDKRVIDIGCSKGYFTMWCAENGARRVIAQDINEQYIGLVREIARVKGHKNVVCTTEKISSIGEVRNVNGIVVTEEGDVALALGVGHQLTYESGLEWIYRLYFMGYDILLEWPDARTDPSVQIHKRTAPAARVALLNLESLRAKIDGLYDIELLGQSPDLGRPLYLLKKRRLPELRFSEMGRGPLLWQRGTSRFYMKGDKEVVIMKPIHRKQGVKSGYARRWVRAQKILSKEYPGVVPRVSALVLGDDGLPDGVVEERLDRNGDRSVGARRLFDLQIYLVEHNLLILDLHISDVVGSGVVDLDGIEVLTEETERWFRDRIPRMWRRGDNTWTKGVNMKAVESFAWLIASGRPLMEALRLGKEGAYFD